GVSDPATLMPMSPSRNERRRVISVASGMSDSGQDRLGGGSQSSRIAEVAEFGYETRVRHLEADGSAVGDRVQQFAQREFAVAGHQSMCSGLDLAGFPVGGHASWQRLGDLEPVGQFGRTVAQLKGRYEGRI